MPRIGVIGTPGGWSSELLADTVGRLTGFRLLIDMENIVLDLETGRVMLGDLDLFSLDGMIVKKIGAWYSPDLLDRLEILRFMAEKGLRICSSPEKILRVIDRLSCTVTLSAAGIPMPPTIVTESVDEAMGAVKRFGRAVFKPLYSTKAKGMCIIENTPDARDRIMAFKAENSIMYIQAMIEHNGMDLGITFLGGRYLTTYARCGNGNSWNTTTRSGGRYNPFSPDKDLVDLAWKAQNLFGLDFTCVDVALTPTGPVVFEVSAFGGFKGVMTTSDIDPAERYVNYVLEAL
ncbi:hypothetical protein JCM14469_32860 [Desulfatiferula olefinivorans]